MSVRRALTLFTLLVAVLGACASPDPHDTADVAFVQQMIPHHEQAVSMADMAPGRAADPEVLRLAAAIRDAQGPEIARMTGYLQRWGLDRAGGGAMTGMMNPATMDRLAASRGVAFDRAWTEDMIAHHTGAVQMADEVLGRGTNSEVRALAHEIVAGQTREIAEMTALRARLG